MTEINFVKVKSIIKKGSIIFASLFALFILVYQNNLVTESALYAIKLSVTSIIPSIFPFFIFADFLGSQVHNDNLSFFLNKFFKIPDNCFPSLVCGLICGCPSGIKWAVKLYDERLITKKELEDIIGLVNQPSFAFTVCAVGIGMLGNIKDGLTLYLITIISIFITSRLFLSNTSKKQIIVDNTRQIFDLTESIKNAGTSSIVVSSYIIFFSIIINLSSNIVKEPNLLALLSSFLEIGNATKIISQTNFNQPLLMYAFLGFSIGFSGLSFHLQAFSLLPPTISKMKYYKIKLSQGFICAIFFALYKII